MAENEVVRRVMCGVCQGAMYYVTDPRHEEEYSIEVHSGSSGEFTQEYVHARCWNTRAATNSSSHVVNCPRCSAIVECRAPSAESLPLCSVHRDLDDKDTLEMNYGNGCIACSLNERGAILEHLAQIVPDNNLTSMEALIMLTATAQPIVPCDLKVLAESYRGLDEERITRALGGRLTSNDDHLVSQLADVVSLARREAGFDVEKRESASSSAECTWTNEGDLDYNDVRWMTSCGHDFLLNEGGPTENKMTHCCYCGTTLKEVRTQHDDTE